MLFDKRLLDTKRFNGLIVSVVHLRSDQFDDALGQGLVVVQAIDLIIGFDRVDRCQDISCFFIGDLSPVRRIDFIAVVFFSDYAKP